MEDVGDIEKSAALTQASSPTFPGLLIENYANGFGVCVCVENADGPRIRAQGEQTEFSLLQKVCNLPAP